MIRNRCYMLIICLCVYSAFCIGSMKINAQADDGLILTYDNVMQIDVNAGGPSYFEHQKYNYSTSSKNEIAYVLNYINNFHLEDDGKTLYPNDASFYSIKLYMIDGSTKNCGFDGGRFYDDSGKQYAADSDEYNRFLNFIYALKTKKIVLNGEVTFEPSEWAMSDIDKAIKNELVPEFNQINYKEKINRLEVCQLIENLLNKQNVTKPNLTENPFSDTTDKSVVNLYNYGIIDGKSESNFEPYDYITREELSKILSNTYYLINQKARSENFTHKYADQEEISDWALNYVGDMYSLNIIIGDQKNEFRPHDNVTKEEAIITILRIYMQE